MPRSFNFKAIKGISVHDPRVVMRVIIGLLLIGNIAAAIVAFKPFGGSLEDWRKDQQNLTGQLSQMRSHLAESKKLVDKVKTAKSDGDGFMGKYFMSEPVTSALM